MKVIDNQPFCDNGCPVQLTANLIEHKWATLIIRELLSGKKRFSELERALAPISPKTLSERLRDFERYQLIARTVIPTVPPTTEYALTQIGAELEHVVQAMSRVGLLIQQQTKTG